MRIASSLRSPPCRGVRTKKASRLTQRSLVFMAIAFLCGCSRDIAGTKPRFPAIADTSLLTPEVASKLSGAGIFTLEGPATSAELTEPQVRAIARAWIKDGLPRLKPRLERQRGQSIDAHGMRDCARIYYGESPYEPLADVTDGGVARRTYGPWWLVPLCAGDEPQVILGVASYANDVKLENGSIRLPKFSGAEFVWRGIAVGKDLPVTPEAAANAVARSTSSKVASVPRLILPSFREGGPAAARWSMFVSPAPTVGVNGRAINRPGNLFLGPDGPGGYEIAALQRASADQPDGLQVQMMNLATRRVDHVAALKRKADVPVRFERVEGLSHE